MTAQPRVTGETSLANSFFSETIQICIVTRDHARTMAGMVQAGIGPWRVYTFDKSNCEDLRRNGQPADFSMKLCITFVGNMMWEIVQPLTGDTIYHEFLERHGEGVHHVAFACGETPWAERVRSFEERGFSCTQSGVWLGQVPWAYFSTEEATTTTFEIFDIPAGFALPEPESWYPAPPPA